MPKPGDPRRYWLSGRFTIDGMLRREGENRGFAPPPIYSGLMPAALAISVQFVSSAFMNAGNSSSPA